MIFVTCITFLVICLLISLNVRILFRIPSSAVWPVSFAIVIGYEAILYNLLSPFHAVRFTPVLIGQLFIIGFSLMVACYVRGYKTVNDIKAMFCLHSYKWRNHRWHILMPLLLLLGITAWIYPPNTYDSLTYHLARVAHWIQNQSIAYYVTPIDRQNVMGPGAEYIILLGQILTNDDKLANFVQFTAFALLISGCLYFCRVLRLSGAMCTSVLLLSVTAPIAIFQATGTKNDIVAALMVYAVLIAARRFILGDPLKYQARDYCLIGIVCGVGLLVKPTVLLISIPMVAGGGFLTLLCSPHRKRLIFSILKNSIFAGVSFFIVAGPDIVRKMIAGVDRFEVYSLFSGYDVDRFWNLYRVVVPNLPFRETLEAFYYSAGGEGVLYLSNALNLQEDIVGNPYQVLAFLACSLLSLVMLPLTISKGANTKLLLAFTPVLAWISFSMVIKSQLWITRLEIPLFYLLPFSFISVKIFSDVFPRLRTPLSALVGGVAMASLACSLFVAANNPYRPLALAHFWGEEPWRTKAYYASANLQDDHDFFLNQLDVHRCKNVGLILGPDSVEYPLTWRAMQRGVSVQHIWEQKKDSDSTYWKLYPEEMDKVCALYVASGSREHVPDQGTRWISAGDYHTFIRNYAWDFNETGKQCFRVDVRNVSEFVVVANEASLSTTENNIVVDTMGGDPQLLLNGINTCHGDGVMQIEIFSQHSSTLQLYYTTKETAIFSEPQSILEKLVPGWNIIYFPVSEEMISNSIRLDIGKEIGTYSVKAIEIRSF